MVESRLLGGLGQVVARVSFLPTLAWNIAMERLSGRRWWDRVDHRVILGTTWGRSIYRMFNRAGVTERRKKLKLNDMFDKIL